ncbi:uncharacterized protein [Haliotis cracherodii]|uniref:uncharacterized protein isoform X3 n=1 Tax=Haliotis cracherodii TaxID=6455 RepID=UPI0039EBD79B
MNNKAKGRGKKRKAPSKEQENQCSQEKGVTNNDELKQTDSQSRVVPTFAKRKKVTEPAPEQTECNNNGSNNKRQEEIEGCDTLAFDKSPLHTETETEAEVSHGHLETKHRTQDATYTVNTEVSIFPKEELPEQEDQHPGSGLTPKTLLNETGSDPAGCITNPQVMEGFPNKTDKTAHVLENIISFANVAKVAADTTKVMKPTGVSCGSMPVSVERWGHVNDVMPGPALTDEAENISLIPSKNILKSLEQCIEDGKSAETDGDILKPNMASVAKLEDIQAHGEMEEADQGHTDQGCMSEQVISLIKVQDMKLTETMGADINQNEENRKGRKCFSLTTHEESPNDPMHVSGCAEESDKTSDSSSMDKSITKNKEVYKDILVDQRTETKKNSTEILQGLSGVTSEQGEVSADEIIPPEMDIGIAEERPAAVKNKEADILAAPGKDVDADMDFTDSQLCEAVSMEESANQLMVLQEVQKQRMEGRKIIHDLIVDLSYLNKLVLRTKREIETARRKRQPQSCVQNRVTGQSFQEHRKF